jgi:hypothetical protein
MLARYAIHRRSDKAAGIFVENPEINAVASDPWREIALGFNESLKRVKAIGYTYGDMDFAARIQLVVLSAVRGKNTDRESYARYINND